MRTARTAASLLVALTLLMVPACGGGAPRPASSFSTPTGTGYLRNLGPLRMLNLEGSYTDMGRQYGALLKHELRDLFTQMDAAIGFDRPETQSLLKLLESIMEPRERQLLEGMASETGLSFDQHEFLNASLFFMYLGCTVCSATGSQTESGHTIAGRNFDNPRGVFSTALTGKTILVVYNPRGAPDGAGSPRDNSVAIVTEIGWLYGLTNLNSKGVYLEYNNGTNSIPIDLAVVGQSMDGLHQNLFAAFDCDSLEEVHERLSGKAAAATITQVADKNRVWHYERSPYQNSRRLFAGEARGAFYYDNPTDMDIFTNHFFHSDWEHQINTDPSKFNKDHDSASRTIARLINVQNLASRSAGRINAERMKAIMTTHLLADGTRGPLIGREVANLDVTIFTTVTDIAGQVMHVYPYLDCPQWVAVDLKREFR